MDYCKRAVMLEGRMEILGIDESLELAHIAEKHPQILDWRDRQALADRMGYLMWCQNIPKKKRSKVSNVRDSLIKSCYLEEY